nr:Chain A, Two-component receiver protein CleD [Caulobacter vibrioides NA1000]
SKPREWVEAVAYVGPDRRRFNSADYKGPRKRKADAS